MSATFDVLVPGYVRQDTDGTDHVRGTVSLIRSADVVMVADPGIMESQAVLIDSLGGHGLSLTDVTHVFVSHHHLDHTRNIGMLPNAAVIDSDSIYSGDIWGEHDGDGYEIADGVSIMLTPGHSAECASLIVETDDKGTVVYTHAWWLSDMTPVEDPMAANQRELEASRAKILAIADVIVPAHGEPFHAPK
jgi:glyoxylase-like metal-dependent hydrolase (beta-lactamase superfamily II)